MPTLLDFALALPWIVTALLSPLIIRRRPRLIRMPVVPAEDAPPVSVIVPARNEADNISACVASLLSSTYPRLEIVLVDDRSTDGTTEIVQTLARQHPDRIRVVHGKDLPEGWVGKCWACWQDYLAATGEILLFTDADTRHEPRLLDHAVGAALDQHADLVTILPRQLMLSFWERVILPHIFVAIMFRYRDFRRMNETRNPRSVIANGQFILFRRDSYEAVGGHEAVRAEIVEDLQLAQRIVAAGRRIFASHAESLMTTRMYRSFKGIVEGWSKNLASASRQTVPGWIRPVLPWLIGFFLLGVWVAPPASLVTSIARGGNPAWSLVTSIAALAFWITSYRRFAVPVHYAVLYPLGATVATALFFRSASLGGRVTWKGRTYESGSIGRVGNRDERHRSP